MNSILVPVDGSDSARRALRFALDLAKRCGPGEVELLNVQPQIESGLVRARLSGQAIDTALRSIGEETLAPYRRLVEETGLAHRHHVAIGHFGQAIVRHAADRACTEIVMGSRGMGPIGSLVLGSVATQVVHLAQVPVTLVKESDDWKVLFEPVLVAVDGSECANRAVEYVVARARRCGAARVRLLNVQEPVVEWQTHGLARAAIAQQREQSAARISQAAKGLLEDAGVAYESDYQLGDPAQTIAREAEAHRCSHIVMGTRGLGTGEALLLGSVAYKTVHGSRVPVTLVR